VQAIGWALFACTLPSMASNDTATDKSGAKTRKSVASPKRIERELVIKSLDDTVEIALLEDGRLVELHHEQLDSQFTVGDIFLGRIRKLNPGLNAAFVDIGHDKEAFLHYSDLGPQLMSMIKYANGAVNGSFKTSKPKDLASPQRLTFQVDLWS